MPGTPRLAGLKRLAVAMALVVYAGGASTAEPGAWQVLATKRAPELPTQDPRGWIGPPTRLADLRGRVVLIDVWTFG